VPYVNASVAVSSLGADERQFVENGSVGDVYGPYLEKDEYKMYRIMGKSNGPESIKARHIMLPVDDLTASLKKADSLLEELQRGGADFAQLAEDNSVDRNSAANGGDLGWFTEETALRGLGQKFKDDCFAAQVNKYFVCQSLYGVHVVQVTEQSASVAKANVAEYVQSVGASSRTFQKLYSDVNTFVAKNNKADLIEKNAAEAGFNLLTQARLTTTDNNLGLIQNARQAVRWAFLNEPGSISEVFEIDNKFVVVIVTGETPAGYTPMAQVEPALRYELLAQKKGEKIVADLKAKGLTSLEAYAEAMGNAVETAKFVSFNTNRIAGIGNEPILCGIAPYSEQGKLTGPIAGNNGVYVFAVDNVVPSETPFNAENEKRLLEGQMTQRLMYQMMMVLRNNAEIGDFRMNMY
jgi:peptidyl-prolyl cis-trans isomerase D